MSRTPNAHRPAAHALSRIASLSAFVILTALLVAGPAAAAAADGAAADTPPAEWVVVTAPAFRDAIEPLRRHRADEGMRVTLLTTSDVLSAEDLRRGDGSKLRRRLGELCGHARGKAYVLLVGVARPAPGADAGTTVVPTLAGTVGRMKGEPTDNGYGCLGEGLLPDVAVGRLPARSAAEAGRMVEKVLAFERDGRREPWRRSLTLLVGNPGGASAGEKALGNWYVGHTCQATSEQINPLWRLRAVYHIPGSPWYVPDAHLRDETLTSLRQGQAFAFYLGHSGPEGFWSNDAPFVDRADWGKLDVPHGAGVFVTCGCFACQPDPAGGEEREGYGLAAVRNPGGPVAVIGASGESYAAMGQLAFTGLLNDFARPALPERLGDAWLDLKAGLAKGPIDFFTFKMFDYGDGSNGTTPLAVQRQEHLEMWTLLGDPALHLPAVSPEIALQAPASAAPGATITLRGSLPASPGPSPSAAEARVRVTVERLSGAPPRKGPANAGNPDARDVATLAGYRRANDPVLLTAEAVARDGKFELPVELPRELPWPRVLLRASVVQGSAGPAGPTEAVGVAVVKVKTVEKPAEPR